MVLTGTKALEAKVSGKSQIKPADWAASTLRTARPIKADTHEKAKLNPIRIRIASRKSPTPPLGRKPTANPIASITPKLNRLRAKADPVRPVSAAEAAIGRGRKRSISP